MAPPSESRPPIVLVVDDDPAVRSFEEKALLAEGYRVITAGNGLSALEMLSSVGRIDLVVSDIEMPQLDGLALLARLRQLPSAPPVLLVSGLNHDKFDGPHLQKPFTRDALCNAVRELLTQSH
jgi:CheY-like chemotaxis protein